MKNSAKDALVVVGYPFAGQTELAQQLQNQGFHREDLADQMRRASSHPGIRPRLLSNAAHRYGEDLTRAGHGALAFFGSQPPPDHYFIDELMRYCLEDAHERLVVAARLGLRAVIDFPGIVRSERKKVLDVFRESEELRDRFNITAVAMETPVDICCERIARAKMAGKDSATHLDPNALRQTRLEPVTIAEGFDRVVSIKPDENGMRKLETAGIDVERHKLDWWRRQFPSARTLQIG